MVDFCNFLIKLLLLFLKVYLNNWKKHQESLRLCILIHVLRLRFVLLSVLFMLYPSVHHQYNTDTHSWYVYSERYGYSGIQLWVLLYFKYQILKVQKRHSNIWNHLKIAYIIVPLTFMLVVLLRNNLYTIKFSHLKCIL